MNEDFKWTDELVGEFNRWEGFKPFKSGTPIEQFKQSKMPKKDKDYEVIEIINSHGGKITKLADDRSWDDWCGLKSFDGFKINAVKRLSDGEIFSVGDEVTYDGCYQPPGKIENFDLLDKEGFPATLRVKGPQLGWPLLSIIKKFPQQSKPEQPDTNWVGAMVKEVMERAYNQGIDHAIQTVENVLPYYSEMGSNIISQLKELKKP